jgi:hypothetical protein
LLFDALGEVALNRPTLFQLAGMIEGLRSQLNVLSAEMKASRLFAATPFSRAPIYFIRGYPYETYRGVCQWLRRPWRIQADKEGEKEYQDLIDMHNRRKADLNKQIAKDASWCADFDKQIGGALSHLIIISASHHHLIISSSSHHHHLISS